MLDAEALQRENAALRAQIERVVSTNATLVEQVARLTERVAELLALAQRRARRPPADKAPAPPPVLGDDARRAFAQRPTAPALPPKPTRDARAATPTGRTALPTVGDRVRAEVSGRGRCSP